MQTTFTGKEALRKEALRKEALRAGRVAAPLPGRPRLDLFAAALLIAAAAAGRGAAVDPAKDRAMLIGIENYKKVAPLKYIHNDVKSLNAILRERGTNHRFNSASVRVVTDGEDGGGEPTAKVLRSKIASFLKELKEDQRAILYFSGHGFRGKQGELYLAPLDFDPADMEQTGLPVAWLREQLSASKAHFKLLVLDACHAGVDQETVPAEELGQSFKELPNVVTLASSTGKQASQLWGEKKQSLFSYWLCQGLKGHADSDGDAAIDIDELYKYVHGNVTRTAKKRLGREQTPVRIVRSGTEGVPIVFTLRARTLDETLNDMAAELAWSAAENALPRLAVFEFTEDSALGKVLGAQYGVLGRYCAAQLQERLLEMGRGDFRVADQGRVENALKEQAFTVDDLGSDDALKRLSEKVGGLSAISLGTFQNRVGRDIGLRCRLVSLDNGDVLSFAGGRANLNESEWGMLGGSGWVDAKRRGSPGGGSSRQSSDVVEELDDQTIHPLRDRNFPFNVRVIVNGRERRGVFERNAVTGKEDYVVTLKRGEVYKIWASNTTGEVACLRLLVDGLNSLPQKLEEKGIKTYEVAARVNLDSARYWVLDPKKGPRPQSVWAVNGFYEKTGVGGSLREFKVVDAASSVAARKGFADQAGLITAAFYHKAFEFDISGMMAGSSGAGTDFGQRRAVDTKESKVQIGKLWAVVNIRYRLED